MMESESKSSHGGELLFETNLEAAPEKVWRAVSRPEFRARWLPAEDLVSNEPLSSIDSREISYRMRSGTPPFVESTVSFHLSPTANGGTHFTIVHRLADSRQQHRRLTASNGNTRLMMRAA